MKNSLALMALLMGCIGDKPETTEVPVGTDQLNQLSNNSCNEYDGIAVAGAAVYFEGQFAVDGSDVRGTERVYFVANDTWVEAGEDSCRITLNVAGSLSGDTGACSVCDTAFELSAALIDAESDCPEGLQEDYLSLQESYAIQTVGDTTNWFFPGSGNIFATGTVDGDVYTYMSEEQCQWY